MVIVVPDVWNYVHMKEKLRYKTVSNLDLTKIELLRKDYPEEVEEGLYKAAEFLGWVARREYSSRIVKLASQLVEKFRKKHLNDANSDYLSILNTV